MGMCWLGLWPGCLCARCPLGGCTGEPSSSELSVDSPPEAEEYDMAAPGVVALGRPEGRRAALRSFLRPAMAMYRPCRVYFATMAGSFQLPWCRSSVAEAPAWASAEVMVTLQECPVSAAMWAERSELGPTSPTAAVKRARRTGTKWLVSAGVSQSTLCAVTFGIAKSFAQYDRGARERRAW